MSDPRPRPQYGEYAPIPAISTTPPAAEAAPPVPEPGPAVTVAKGIDPASTDPLPQVEWPRPTAPLPRQRTWDVLLTIFLLGLGVADVITGYAQFADLPALLRTLYIDQGIGEYGATSLALSLGGVANASRILIIVLAVVLSMRRLRANRIAFWIPLSAGALAALTVTVCVFIAVLGDPQLAEYVATTNP